MSIETPNSKQSQPIESGTIGHSGNLGLEKPVELSNQPLNTIDKVAPHDASGLTGLSQPEVQANPTTSPQERRGFGKRGKIILGATSLVVAAGAIFGGVAASNGGNQAAETSQEQEEPAVPDTSVEKPEAAPVDPESLVVVDELPESVVEHGMFELLTPTEKKEIRAMDEMSVEEFRALPEEEQVQFAEFVYRNNLPILKHRLGNSGQAGIFDQANLTTPEGVSNQYKVTFALITSLNEFDNGIYYDFDTAKKLAVLLTDPSGELGAQRLKGIDSAIDLMNVNTSAVVIDTTLEAGRIEPNGDILTTIYNNGTGDRAQQTYHKETFQTVDGRSLELSRTILGVNDKDSRYVPLG